MGLFGKKTPKKTMEKIDPGFKKLEKALEYQTKLLDRFNAEKGSADTDEGKIAIYEKYFINADPPLKSTAFFDLINLYVKTGQHDKAWAALNKAIITGEYDIGRIRSSQATILEKEEKYSDAVGMYMLSDMHRYSGIEFQEADFKKHIKKSAKKMGLTEEQQNDLVRLIKNRKDCDDKKLMDAYRRFVEGIK